jgi:hypothetical protein
MPAWQPNWNDVTFDFAAAEAAIVECRLAREVLQTRDTVLSGPLAQAREQWRGAKRIEFDETEAALGRDVDRLIDELRDAEQSLYADIAQANNEQTVRVRARAKWFEELREEQALERRRDEIAAEARAAEAAKAEAGAKTKAA